MQNEADACTILKNSVIAAGGQCYKIPDPSSDFRSTIQRPFDIFGAFQARPLYAEVKHDKGGLFSFDLQRIEDHQIEALVALGEEIPNAMCWIVLAMNVGRGDKRIYIFDDVYAVAGRRKERRNFLKKELETLPYFEIHANKEDKRELIDLTGYPLTSHGNTRRT